MITKKRKGPPAQLGKFVTVGDYEALKALFRTARALRNEIDEGDLERELRRRFPQEWTAFRAALLDVEMRADQAREKGGDGDFPG